MSAPLHEPLNQMEGGDNKATVKEEREGASMCIAIATLLLAIPALVGSWCWPILVGAIFAVAAQNVNGGLVDFFHGLQVAIMCTVMTNVLQFAHWTVSRKRKGQPHCSKFGPVYLLLVATVLVNIQPMCMLVIGSWNLDNFFFNGGDTGHACSADANCKHGCMTLPPLFDCTKGVSTGTCVQMDCATAFPNGTASSHSATVPCGCAQDSNALQPNTTIGLVIQIFGTYLGFALLFVGVFQATELHTKMCKRWREIRGPQRPPEDPDCATW